MGTSKNKTTRQNANRKIAAAIKKHLSGPIVLAGVTYAPPKLAQMFQEGIDLADATDAAKKVWLRAVAKEQDTTQKLSSVEASLRATVLGTYGETSTEFSDFGFAPKTVKTVDAATKAEAVKKRAGTRAIRRTMGKRQKEKVTSETTPETLPPTTPAAPPPATGTTANGAPATAKPAATA